MAESLRLLGEQKKAGTLGKVPVGTNGAQTTAASSSSSSFLL